MRVVVSSLLVVSFLIMEKTPHTLPPLQCGIPPMGESLPWLALALPGVGKFVATPDRSHPCGSPLYQNLATQTQHLAGGWRQGASVSPRAERSGVG